jgi:hypothetical protein
LAYWQKQLDGVAVDVELPLDRPRPPVPSMRGGLTSFAIEAECTARWTSRRERTA